MRTLTKNDLVKYLFNELGLPEKEITSLTNSLLDEIIYLAAETGKCRVENLGTFKIYKSKERLGRNPKTKEEYLIAPKNSLRFSASTKLKESLKND